MSTASTNTTTSATSAKAPARGSNKQPARERCSPRLSTAVRRVQRVVKAINGGQITQDQRAAAAGLCTTASRY